MIKWTVISTCASLLFSSAMAQGPAGAGASPEAITVAKNGNDFAFDLYARLAAESEGNLFFSPSSIHTALAMTYAGAAGETAEQMARTLRCTLTQDELASASGEFLRILNTPRERSGAWGNVDPAYELVVSNALWSQRGYPFKPRYLELARGHYGATVEELDFVENPTASRKTINDAVARQTRDRIADLVPPGAITPLTRLILTNAIYFKSRWMHEFSKGATQDAPFRISADRTLQAPMMNREGTYAYFETDRLQCLEMPYLYGDLSMYVLLPRAVDGLPELERNLSAEEVASWLGGCREARVEVSFPRFEFSSEFMLAKRLAEMGMPDAFTPGRADFSGMTAAERIWIDEVVHKSFVAVDEEGTEAAAATADLLCGSAMLAPEEPKTFHADHPFLFFIRHNGTGAVLFVGRVVAP